MNCPGYLQNKWLHSSYQLQLNVFLLTQVLQNCLSAQSQCKSSLLVLSCSTPPTNLFRSVCLALHYIRPESDIGCSRQISLNLFHSLFFKTIMAGFICCQQESPQSAVCSHVPFVECKTSCLWRLLTCSSSLPLCLAGFCSYSHRLGEAIWGAASCWTYLSIWAKL